MKIHNLHIEMKQNNFKRMSCYCQLIFHAKHLIQTLRHIHIDKYIYTQAKTRAKYFEINNLH